MQYSRHNSGFTIVELIIVITVIGILVGITVFAYGGWRMRVADNQVRSDLNGVSSAMENARNWTSGAGSGYPTSVPSSFQASDGVTVTYDSGSATAYCIEAVSTQYATVLYHITAATGRDPLSGGC